MMKNTKEILSRYVREFIAGDEELAKHAIPNSIAEEWMIENVPRISVPDVDIERAYYFRWFTYRKHLRNTPEGCLITEFLPDVDWAGDYNTIPCAVGHHIREGRWLKNNGFLDEYIRFWLNGRDKQLHNYSNWFESSIESLAVVRGDETGLNITDALIRNLQIWYDEQMSSSGLFWSDDGHDGSEFSITGSGLRPTLNSYIYAGNIAVAKMLDRKGCSDEAAMLNERAAILLQNIEKLWDEEKRFYIAIPQEAVNADPIYAENRRARELFGYLPWMFGAAKPGRSDAFLKLLDSNGFDGAFGTAFAERNHQGYGVFYTGSELNNWLISRGEKPIGPEGHECLWNGPSWPFATSLMLTSLANMLVTENQNSVSAQDYVFLLKKYAASHKITLENGIILPWIDENMNPDTGDWIARTRLMNWNGKRFPTEKGGYERGKDYNHSTFCDLVLEGLFGIRPDWNGLTIAPLFSADWKYANLENLTVHGKTLTIKYSADAGYSVSLAGKVAFTADKPEKCTIAFT